MQEPLYRKVNTLARCVHHNHGGDYRHRRTTEEERTSDATRGPMRGGKRRGRDYPPLFRFLLSKVGEDFDAVLSEASARLDSTDPVFWLVAREERERYVRVGRSTYYSGLYVDADNRLQLVDPTLGPESLRPSCPCCTHTLNGVPFVQRYSEG